MSGYGRGSGDWGRGNGGGGVIKIADVQVDQQVTLRGCVLKRTPMHIFPKDTSRGVFNLLLADSTHDSINVVVWGAVDDLSAFDSIVYKSVVELTASIKDKRDQNIYVPDSTSRYEASVSGPRDGGVIPLSILDESDPATTPLQSLYREPILGVSLTTIDQVHAMVDRLEGLGPKEHVTVSVLVIVEPNILTKTIISPKSFNPLDVTELMVVDGSGLTGVSRIKLSLWSDPFGRAMLEKLLPFQSVILLVNAEAKWSKYDKEVVLTCGSQTVVIQDPDTPAGLALYNQAAQLEPAAALSAQPNQDEWVRLDDLSVMTKMSDVSGRIDGYFRSVQPHETYIKSQPRLAEDNCYTLPLDVEIIDLHGRALAVIAAKVVESVLGSPADLAAMDDSARDQVWSRLVSAHREFAFNATKVSPKKETRITITSVKL